MRSRFILSVLYCIIVTIAASGTENTDPAYTATADETIKLPQYRNIYVEFMGPSNMAGISYDSRLKPGSKWGYRIGLGYAYGTSIGILDAEEHVHMAGIPIEFNGIFGKKKSKFEAGFGVNLGMYHHSWHKYNIIMSNGGIYLSKDNEKQIENRFYHYCYFNIGYRYQRPSGFQFRIGISPMFSFTRYDGVISMPLLCCPYLSFGYTLK